MTDIKSDFGATGDGTTDDSSAFLSMIKLANTSKLNVPVVIPSGSYRLATDLHFPVGLTLSFERGARLLPDNTVTITMDARIVAARLQIFGGTGRFKPSVKPSYPIFPEWFGASGSGNEYTVQIQSGSNQLVFSQIPDYKIGQTIRVLYAGTPGPSVGCTPLTVAPTVSQFTQYGGTPGTTTYQYTLCSVSKKGAIAAQSPVATTTTGNANLNVLSWNRITFPTGTGLGGGPGYLMYGRGANPQSSQGLVWFCNSSKGHADDLGRGSMLPAAPPWVPANPPADNSMNYEWLDAHVTDGEGTTTLSIDATCQNTLANSLCYHDDTDALNTALLYLSYCGGGQVKLRSGGQYNITVTDDVHSLYIYSGTELYADGKATLKTWVNIAANNGPILQPANALNHVGGWVTDVKVHGVTFDSGDGVDYDETGVLGFSYYAGSYNRSTAETYANGLKNIEFEDCDFYTFSHGIDFQFANAWYWRVTNCRFVCNSNAIGVGGCYWTLDNNLFEECKLTEGGKTWHDYIGNAESIIGSGPYIAHALITNNRIRNWGPISLVGDVEYLTVEGNTHDVVFANPINGGGCIGIASNLGDIVIIGNTMTGSGSGSNVSVTGNRITVSNNTIIGGQWSTPYGQYSWGGVHLSGTEIVFSGNHVFYGTVGVTAKSNFVSITGNTMSGNARPTQIQVLGDNVTIAGNTTDSNVILYVGNKTGGSILGNTINSILLASNNLAVTGNMSSMIQVLNGNSCVISSNTISQLISILSGSNHSIAGNSVRGGIDINGNSITVFSNNIQCVDTSRLDNKGVIKVQGTSNMIVGNLIDDNQQNLNGIWDGGSKTLISLNSTLNLPSTGGYHALSGTSTSSTLVNNFGIANLQLQANSVVVGSSVLITSGQGAPSSVPVFGSLYLRTDTGRLYVYEQAGGWTMV